MTRPAGVRTAEHAAPTAAQAPGVAAQEPALGARAGSAATAARTSGLRVPLAPRVLGLGRVGDGRLGLGAVGQRYPGGHSGGTAPDTHRLP
ncbi:hypothetical protein ACIPMT_20145 [Streptomyces griseus]|uniref:hypothetical protein n=1 Tax=Streptomyces griseus TaxID=1911 RepID=UPI0038134567